MERSEWLKKQIDEHMLHSSTVVFIKHQGQKCTTMMHMDDAVPTSHFPLILENIKKDLNRIRARRKTKYNRGGQRNG